MTEQRQRIKVLMAHGFGQSGRSFQYHTHPLERAIRASLCDRSYYYDLAIEFHYMDAPIQCTHQDPTSEQRCWTREVDNSNDPDITDALTGISTYIKEHGPFNGAIGFSQGGLMLAMAAAFLEPERIVGAELSHYSQLFCKEGSNEKIQPSFEFLICVCSPDAPNRIYTPLWSPQVATPMLQVVGEWDPMIEEASTRGLAARFHNATVLVHCGGHFVPRNSVSVGRMARFVVDCSICISASDEEGSEKSSSTNNTPSTTGSSNGPIQFRRVWKRLYGRQRAVVRISRKHDKPQFFQ